MRYSTHTTVLSFQSFWGRALKVSYWFRFIVVALLVIYAGAAFSLSTISVLADTDDNPATGCSVSLPISNQTISGIERRLVATVDGVPEQVLATSIEVCNGTVFSPPQPVAGNFPYPVGADPIDNSSVVEFAIETNAIAQPGDTIRFHFSRQSATDDDLLDLTLAGAPILFSITDPLAPPVIPVPPSTSNPAQKIPTTSFWGFILLQSLLLGAVIRWRRTQGMRFFLLACLSCTLSIALAAGFVTDGKINDWLGENPAAIDPAGDAATDADLLECYIAEENATLFFRCDTANAATSQDSPPVAVADTATLVENTAATTIDVLANDSDTDAGPIAIIAVTQPSNGSVFITNNGSDLTFQPNANFCNDGTPTDDFTYTLTPGGSSATVTVTVTCGNNPPVVVDDILAAIDDTATVNENSTANAIDVLSNDTGASLTIDTITQGTNGTVAITGGGNGLSYTPNAQFNGTDSFTYSISDSNADSDSATVSITITSINDNPTATDDLATVAEDSAATAIPVLGNDSFAPDIGETLSISGVTQGANGVVTMTDSGSGLTYMPDADFNGSDTFTYTLSDGNGGIDTGTVGVTVTPINDAPNANLQMLSVNEDATLPITLTGSDIDANDLTYTISAAPTNGT
ncbi:MAG: Ig-like domain-containing protein, partial [Methylococcales bacterium]